MPRATPSDRIEKLLDAAAQAFVANGFARTQMDDVASRLGVSKGTVYNSVDSKASLLAAVLLYADDPATVPAAGLPSITLDGLAALVPPAIAAEVATLPIVDPPKEADDIGPVLERLVGEQFSMMAKQRTRIMVLDRCVGDIPQLAGPWYDAGRYAVEDHWVRWLDEHVGSSAAAVDSRVLARTIVELITLWAVKMPWDPAPRAYTADPGPPCVALVRNLVLGARR